MRVAVMTEYHRPLELAERPVPEPAGPSDVLIRIGGAGVCATDLHALEGLMEPAGVTLPRVLGHENAGWVEEVGSGVTTVAKGDAVLVYPPHSCGLCIPCRRGNDMHCARHEFTGLSVDGGFADYVAVPERSLIKLPAGIAPADVAPHSDAGVTAYHAVRRLAHLAEPGTTSVVIGVGGVGHIALQLVRVLGAGSVIAVDTDPRRRALAAELGADHVLDAVGAVDAVRELTEGRGADLVFDFVGVDQTHADGSAMLARGGTYSIIGYGGMVTVPSVALVVGRGRGRRGRARRPRPERPALALGGVYSLFAPSEHERLDAALDYSRRVLEAAGATQVCWTGIASTHVQGTCRMGSDPERSVVDADAQLWDVKRLYVGDGSVVPRTLSVNPSLTIMALADRLASHLDADPHGYLAA